MSSKGKHQHTRTRTRAQYRRTSDDAYNAAADYPSTPTNTSRRLSLPDTLHNLYALDNHHQSFKVGYASVDSYED